VKAAVLPGMIEMQPGILASHVMPDPAVAIHVRNFGMARLIGKTMRFSLRFSAVRLGRRMRRRGATERGWTAPWCRAGVEVALGRAASTGLSTAFLGGNGHSANEQGNT
jgi:hypothetical protein